VNGTPYNAPVGDSVEFSMAQGGVDLSPYYAWEDKIPAEAKAKVEEIKAKIMDGSFTVPLDESPIETK
jgi:basic membrane protein A and related proteins